MKKGKSKKVISILTVICALITLVCIFSDSLLKLYLSFRFKRNLMNAGSVGIIGGADGPTAVFVAGKLSLHWFTAIFALLTVLGIAYLIVTGKRRRPLQ